MLSPLPIFFSLANGELLVVDKRPFGPFPEQIGAG
jgi:hypothetical protein